MVKQFVNMDCSRGAPMGRWTYNKFRLVARSIRCFKVNLDTGGYDDGGAYWGHGGGSLYCLDQPEQDQRDWFDRPVYFRVFVRASSRAEAMERAGVPVELLKRRA